MKGKTYLDSKLRSLVVESSGRSKAVVLLEDGSCRLVTRGYLLNECVELEEAEPINEWVTKIGNEKYNAYKGRYYHYDASGKRTEITKDEYTKAVTGAVATKKRPEFSIKASNSTHAKMKINGREYSASIPGMSGKEVADKIQSIAKHNVGTAIKWLEKNGKVTHVGGAPADGKRKKS